MGAGIAGACAVEAGACGAPEEGAFAWEVVPPCAGGGAFCAAGDELGAMVMVRPSLAKVAITGIVEVTVSVATPLASLKFAEGIVLLPKVSVGDAGATSGSRENVMRTEPGSVAILGFTGAVK